MQIPSLHCTDHSDAVSPRHQAMADFFSPDVFHAVLNDPATANRLKSFCDASACSENIAFLEKVNKEAIIHRLKILTM